MKYKFTWDAELEAITVYPPIPTGLTHLEQIDLVIQKMETLKSAIEESGARPLVVAGERSCAFCVSVTDGDDDPRCSQCVIQIRTGQGCGPTGLRRAKDRGERIDAVNGVLAELRKHKEQVDEDNKHPD